MKKLLSYVIVFVAVILLNQYIFMLASIPSESMEPTLTKGDLVWGTRFDRENVDRYDVVIFKYPDDESIPFIKRCIGLLGETIEIKDGVVYADGVQLEVCHRHLGSSVLLFGRCPLEERGVCSKWR